MSKLEIQIQNRSSKSKLKIETWNQNSKLEVEARNQLRVSISSLNFELRFWIWILDFNMLIKNNKVWAPDSTGPPISKHRGPGYRLFSQLLGLTATFCGRLNNCSGWILTAYPSLRRICNWSWILINTSKVADPTFGSDFCINRSDKSMFFGVIWVI